MTSWFSPTDGLIIALMAIILAIVFRQNELSKKHSDLKERVRRLERTEPYPRGDLLLEDERYSDWLRRLQRGENVPPPNY